MSENNSVAKASAQVTTDRKLMKRLVTSLEEQRRKRPYAAIAVLGAALVAGTYGVTKMSSATEVANVSAAAQEAAGYVTTPEGVKFKKITHEEAAAHVGQNVECTFTVQGGYRNPTGSIALINAQHDYKSPNCLTVVCFPSKQPAFGSIDPRGLIGRTITVRGTVTRYKDRPQPQVVLNDPGQLKVQ